MNKFDVAHINEQGVNMIIIPLDPSFGSKSSSAQNSIIASLERCAHNAGLAGTVVPVWRNGSSHSFICPPNWTPFFKTFSWNSIIANVNKELTCG
jgi:hypothetical protein